MNALRKDAVTVKLRSIAFNTIYNLLGYSIPLLLAILVIPLLLLKLGTDKFGVLNLAWIVIGYFGFFDLGIGRALTKIISEKIGLNQTHEIPAFFWTSMVLTFLFSSFVSFILFFVADSLILGFFKIPAEIQAESIKAFYALIFVIPVVTTTAAIRGFLEAYQRFDIINIIRVLLGVSSFLIPVIVLFYTNNLFWIVLFLAIARILIWFLYFAGAVKQNFNILSSFQLNVKLVKPIFKLSSWMTVSNITVPIIVYLDRIVIASLISAAAVAYYATPYEVITKLLVVPGAITAVLFPTFAANYIKDPATVIKLSNKAMKYIGLTLFPVISIVIIFAQQLLQIWLGIEFATKSYLILQFLAAGILFNSIAYIPFSFIEGIGRPDITAKIQLFELPIYVLMIWIAVNDSGIYGAAFVYMLRMMVDCFFMIYFSKRVIGEKLQLTLNTKIIFLMVLLLILFLAALTSNLSFKITLSLSLVLVFIFASLKYFLDSDDKIFIKTKIHSLLEK